MPNDELLLDTNVVSYIMKGAPEAELYMPHLQRAGGRILCVSFVTIGELYAGAEIRNWSAKRRALLDQVLRNFAVVPYNVEVARCYGRVVAAQRRAGRGTGPDHGRNDQWIAASALAYGATLVTHNARHFQGLEGLGLQIITESAPRF